MTAPHPSALHVLAGGPLTTVQDLGRPGHGALGIGSSGALDRASHARSNRLVGNHPEAATLEVTFGGFAAVATSGLWVAACGATGSIWIDGVENSCNYGLSVNAGQTIRVDTPTAGVRTYLAVRGGIDVDPVLGSRSRDTLAMLGPAVVVAGVVLPVGHFYADFPTTDYVPLPPPSHDPSLTLEFSFGPRHEWFTARARELLVSQRWQVDPASNRIGVRLNGPVLARSRVDELPSEGVVDGAIQVPPSGPIVFLDDHPVTGGYPVIGVVTRRGMDLLAQARGGDEIRFAAQRTAESPRIVA